MNRASAPQSHPISWSDSLNPELAPDQEKLLRHGLSAPPLPTPTSRYKRSTGRIQRRASDGTGGPASRARGNSADRRCGLARRVAHGSLRRHHATPGRHRSRSDRRSRCVEAEGASHVVDRLDRATGFRLVGAASRGRDPLFGPISGASRRERAPHLLRQTSPAADHTPPPLPAGTSNRDDRPSGMDVAGEGCRPPRIDDRRRRGRIASGGSPADVGGALVGEDRGRPAPKPPLGGARLGGTTRRPAGADGPRAVCPAPGSGDAGHLSASLQPAPLRATSLLATPSPGAVRSERHESEAAEARHRSLAARAGPLSAGTPEEERASRRSRGAITGLIAPRQLDGSPSEARVRNHDRTVGSLVRSYVWQPRRTRQKTLIRGSEGAPGHAVVVATSILLDATGRGRVCVWDAICVIAMWPCM